MLPKIGLNWLKLQNFGESLQIFLSPPILLDFSDFRRNLIIFCLDFPFLANFAHLIHKISLSSPRNQKIQKIEVFLKNHIKINHIRQRKFFKIDFFSRSKTDQPKKPRQSSIFRRSGRRSRRSLGRRRFGQKTRLVHSVGSKSTTKTTKSHELHSGTVATVGTRFSRQSISGYGSERKIGQRDQFDGKQNSSKSQNH